MPLPLLLAFEEHSQLGPTFAAELLGIAYVTYAQYRSGARPLQRYHRNHIQALMLLPKIRLHDLVKEHVREQS